jgi:hypothetical protein
VQPRPGSVATGGALLAGTERTAQPQAIQRGAVLPRSNGIIDPPGGRRVVGTERTAQQQVLIQGGAVRPRMGGSATGGGTNGIAPGGGRVVGTTGSGSGGIAPVRPIPASTGLSGVRPSTGGGSGILPGNSLGGGVRPSTGTGLGGGVRPSSLGGGGTLGGTSLGGGVAGGGLTAPTIGRR